MPGPRQVVIDKCAFQGIQLDALCDFAASHRLVVPDVLCYECHTDRTDRPHRTLADCEKLIRHGGSYCTCSTGFMRAEGDSLKPYPSFLADLNLTGRIREGASGWLVINAERLLESRTSAAREMLLDVVRTISEKTRAKIADASTDIGRLPPDTKERLRVFLGRAESDMHDFAVRSVQRDWVRDSNRFCVSSDWVSWQYFRLLRACVMDCCCRAIAGGPVGEARAEHDYQDMEYVVLLSRADGIITRDKKLVEPLAHAAYPERDVFSSLDEVPDSYRCDWAEG